MGATGCAADNRARLCLPVPLKDQVAQGRDLDAVLGRAGHWPVAHCSGDEVLPALPIHDRGLDQPVLSQYRHQRLHAFSEAREADVDVLERLLLPTQRWSGEPVNAEPQKCSELVWVERDSLPPDVIPYVRHALESTRSNIRFSEFGWS